MNLVSVELLGKSSNAVVVRLPGRKHPGIVLQGDSLHAAEATVTRALEALRSGETREAIGEMDALRATLRALRRAYEQALAENDLPLPYVKQGTD